MTVSKDAIHDFQPNLDMVVRLFVPICLKPGWITATTHYSHGCFTTIPFPLQLVFWINLLTPVKILKNILYQIPY